ncbi:MAG TPA: glycosyltransferase family 4 protein [Gemmatimonadales bacterium]
MRILIGHNRYLQPGGEDSVAAAEAALLRAHGHDVVLYTKHNEEVARLGAARAAARAVWNGETYRELDRLLCDAPVDVAHFHNTFPLISPAAYYACRARGTPVIQTLHNYRLICPTATLLREGKPCSDCVGRRVPWPGVAHKCYRGSRSASAAVALMLTSHRLAGTWTRLVTRYVAISEFVRSKYVQGGLPASRITVKPNFVAPDPGPGRRSGGYAVFVGRLSPEKGIATLLEAWSRPDAALPLWIVGDGPMAADVRAAAAASPRIRWLGPRPPEETRAIIGDAATLVFPSIWPETFGLVLVEAFACGVPVVASALGAPADLVTSQATGFLVPPGDAGALLERAQWLWKNHDAAASMGRRARSTYETKYTAEVNYLDLMRVYREAGVPAAAHDAAHEAARDAG